MFAGGRRRNSNIRVMQLFHELKQQFPTVPDHIVTACISEFANRNVPEGDSESESSIREVLEAAKALRSATEDNQELMGRKLTKPIDPATSLLEPKVNSHNPKTNETTTLLRQERFEMNEGESDINRNVVKAKCSDDTIGKNSTGDKKNAPQRPNYLDIKPTDAETSGFNKIQLSERCFDLQKLLNADNLNVKPPRSPVVLKKFSGNSKNSPTNAEQSTKSPLESPDTLRKNLYHRSVDSGNCSASNSGTLPNGGGLRPPESSGKRPETVETPTQTSDTLIGAGSVNLSLNVNCQMDLVQSPTVLKHTSALLVNPQMPWCQDPTTQRSYTSVNLTLRPPSTEPQPPIDITSQNSSLTYSTSSFDSQKGLQSRLQITVGPGGGSVSSFRTRPRSSYCLDGKLEETVPVRAESMPDLATNQTSPVIKRQQACIDRLRIELVTEKSRLVSMQNEVDNLLKPFSITFKVDAEVEKQLQKEIKHLRGQCERLTYDVDRQSESRVPLGETNEEFYRNIYTGQRGPLTLGSSERRQTQQQEVRSFPQEIEGPKWNCHMCTFQNHPLLDKCEQCEMPRILHGMKSEPPNPCVSFQMVRQLNDVGQIFDHSEGNTSVTSEDSNDSNSNILFRRPEFNVSN